MKEIINVLAKDIYSENFTVRECVVFGVVAPALLLVLMMLASVV